MPLPAAEITIPVNAAATSFGEREHLDFELRVTADGETFVRVWGRGTGSGKLKLLAEFDAYEFERFRKAIGECGELMTAVQERGATFKIG